MGQAGVLSAVLVISPQALVKNLNEITHLLGVPNIHPAVRRFPGVVGRLADPVLPAQVRDLPTGLDPLEQADDLFLAKSALAHLVPLWQAQGTGTSRCVGDFA